MSTGGGYSDAHGSSTGKRRRISLACSICRTRKSRCDGVRPKCSGCEELGFECIYVNPASSSNVIVGKEYLSGLEDRLKTVEFDIRVLKAKENRPRQRTRFEDELEDAIDGPGEGSQQQHSINSEEVEVDSGELQDSSGHENGTDGIGSMVFSVEEDCGFFGPSSNIAFTRHISHAMAYTSQSAFAAKDKFSPSMPLDHAIISISQPPSPSGRIRAPRETVGTSNGDKINIYALPNETITRNLIARYFGDTGLLFPYIHEQTFLNTYNEIKANGFTKIRRAWLGLLNMIMAMATSTTIVNGLSAEKRARESDVYYQRAMGLCKEQIMRGTSLEIVQYLLLTGLYLQGTQRSVEAWTVHGLAVKAAFQLGLHSTAASSRFSPLDQEFRKRVWYGCVVLDRTLSMTFGRPAAIPDDYVRMQLPQSLGRAGLGVSHDPMINDTREASVAFFNATITLYKILWNIINQLYDGNIGCGPPNTVLDIVSRLFALEQQLAVWQRQLPPSLDQSNISDLIHSPGSTETTPPALDRFRIIIKLRHHNVRILLHRPILVKFLDMAGKSPSISEAQEASSLQQIGSNSIQTCVQSSMEIIAIVRAIVGGSNHHRSLLGAWWFSLYYTFNAALVIFASLLIVRDHSVTSVIQLPLRVSDLDLWRSLVDASQALRRLDRENRMVDRCAAYLEQLASISEPPTASGFDMPALSNTFSEKSTSSLLSLSQNGQLLGSNLMGASPLGMDLGEFLMEGDLDFFGYEVFNQIASEQQAQVINKTKGGVMGISGSDQIDSGGAFAMIPS